MTKSSHPIISTKKKQPESFNFLARFIETMSKITGVSIILKNETYLPKEEDFRLDNSYFIHNSKFCNFIKSYPNELKRCWNYERNKADKKLHSTKKMFVTKCRFGVIDVHIPIIKGNDFLGSIVLGQVFFEKPSLNNFHQIQKKLTKSSKIDIKKLFQIYLKASYITQNKLMNIVNQIDLLADYIIEINEKNKLMQKLRKTYRYEDISKTTNFKTSQEAIIKRAIDFIKKNYNKKITLEDVGRVVFLSPDYLSHLFKNITAKSFTDFINDLRIERAKILLKNPLISIKNIAYELGVNNPYYFSRFFTSKVKIPPSVFRKKLNQ